MQPKVFVRIAAFFLCVTAVYFSLSYINTLESNRLTQIDSLTISEAQFSSLGLLYIAEKNGYFAQQGLRVNFRSFAVGRDALTDTLDGNSDLATVYDTPFVRRLYEGNDLIAVSSLHKSSESTCLFSLTTHGVYTPSDLVGKRIGVVKGTSVEFFLQTLLVTNGIRNNEVAVIYLEPNELAPALASNAVDAVVAYNQLIPQLEATYQDRSVKLYSDIYVENSLLVGNRNLLANKRRAVVKLLKALAQAELFTRTHREESIQIVDEAVKTADRLDVEALWDKHTMTLQIDNVLLSSLHSQGQWLRSIGTYPSQNTPDFRNAVDEGYLKEVNPRLVTIF